MIALSSSSSFFLLTIKQELNTQTLMVKRVYLALLEMQATLCENLSVDIVSPKLASSIDIVAIIAVRQFPPTYNQTLSNFYNMLSISIHCLPRLSLSTIVSIQFL